MTPNYIAVCTPARDMVHANYAFCITNMVAHHTINTTDAVSLKIMQGTLIQTQRADLCLDAMAEGCTHILLRLDRRLICLFVVMEITGYSLINISIK